MPFTTTLEQLQFVDGHLFTGTVTLLNRCASMSQPHLNHITILHIHKERTDQLDMLEIARNFISTNNRQRLYFGELTLAF